MKNRTWLSLRLFSPDASLFAEQEDDERKEERERKKNLDGSNRGVGGGNRNGRDLVAVTERS